jgi:hypothetical protein
MTKVVLRWVMPILALFVLGPSASRLVGLLRASDGSQDVTLLVNTTPALGVLVAFAIVALALVGALPAARFLGARVGLTVAGLTLGWAAWYTAPIGLLARSHSGSGLLITLLGEGVLMLGLGLVILLGVIHVGESNEGDPLCAPVREQLHKSLKTGPGLGAMAGALVASMVIAWFVATEPTRGQALFAGFLGGIGAGSVGVWCGSFLGKDVPPLAALMGVLLACVAAPALGLLMPGGEALRDAVVSDTLPGPVRLQPFDVLVGMTLGAPIGLGWVGSMLDTSEHASGRRPARA